MLGLISRIAVATAGLIVLAGCASAEGDEVVYEANHVEYTTANELTADADLIVVGTPVGAEVRLVNVDSPPDGDDPERNPGHGAPDEGAPTELVFTVYAFEIDDVVSGDAKPGEVIEVGILGGEYEGVSYREGTFEPLRVGETHGLFLKEFGGDVPAQLLNRHQASYHLAEDGTFLAVQDSAITQEAARLLKGERE